MENGSEYLRHSPKGVRGVKLTKTNFHVSNVKLRMISINYPCIRHFQQCIIDIRNYSILLHNQRSQSSRCRIYQVVGYYSVCLYFLKYIYRKYIYLLMVSLMFSEKEIEYFEISAHCKNSHNRKCHLKDLSSQML